MEIMATQRSRCVNKDFPRTRMGTRSGLPLCSTSRCQHASEIGVFFIVMPEISRAVFCLGTVQIARDAAARRGATRCVSRKRDPAPRRPFPFRFFFSPFFFFHSSLTHSSVIPRAQVNLSGPRRKAARRVRVPSIFRYRREKLVANTNYYLSREIQAAAHHCS